MAHQIQEKFCVPSEMQLQKSMKNENTMMAGQVRMSKKVSVGAF